MTSEVTTDSGGSADTKLRGKLLGSLVVISFAVGLDASGLAVVNATLPEIGRDMNIGESGLQWLMTGYAVTFAGFLLFGGRLADSFCRRRVFMSGIGTFTAASLIAAVAPVFVVLVAARAVQGIGAAISVPAALALLFYIFPEGALRNKALGIYGAVASASFSFGLVLGGMLAGLFGWRSVFVVTMALGACVLAASRPLLPSCTGDPKPLDLPGAMMVTAGMLLAVFGITRGGEVGWGHTTTVLSLAMAIILLISFVAWELHTAEPLLPMSLFRIGPVRAATVAAVQFYALVGAVLFFSPLYLQGMLGYSPFLSGLAVMPLGVIIGIVVALASRLLGRIGHKPFMISGLLCQGVGIVYFVTTPLDGNYLLHVLPGLVLMGIGQGVAYPPMTAASLTGVDPERHGIAGAANITSQQVGVSLGTATLVVVAAAWTPGTAAADTLAGFHAAYIGAGVISLLGVLTIALIRMTPKQTRPASSVPEPMSAGAQSAQEA